jgi:hypothetical protein
MSVAARDLQAGDVALSIPDKLTVTLDRIFQSETVAELLTTGGVAGRRLHGPGGGGGPGRAWPAGPGRPRAWLAPSCSPGRWRRERRSRAPTRGKVLTHLLRPLVPHAGKLSELAVLALYLMYEKKVRGRHACLCWQL